MVRGTSLVRRVKLMFFFAIAAATAVVSFLLYRVGASYGADAHRLRAFRILLLLFAAGLTLLSARGLHGAWWAWTEGQARIDLLREEGEAATAHAWRIRRKVSDDDYLCSYDYRFETAGGRIIEGAYEIRRKACPWTPEGRALGVVYLPRDPSMHDISDARSRPGRPEAVLRALLSLGGFVAAAALWLIARTGRLPWEH